MAGRPPEHHLAGVGNRMGGCSGFASLAQSLALSAPTREIQRCVRLTIGRDCSWPALANVRNAVLVEYWCAKDWPDQCRAIGADDFASSEATEIAQLHQVRNWRRSELRYVI